MKEFPRLGLLLAFVAVLLPGTPHSQAQIPLIPPGSSWDYFFEGVQAPPGWNGVPFEPLPWQRGTAKLGFGDDGEVTVLPNADSGFIAAYFRLEFFVEDPSHFTNFMGRIVADDGAVVYLNGVEIARIQMYPGPVAYSTLAASDLGRPLETNWINFVPQQIPLFSGPNVLGVEVHQASQFSRDLGFDFALLANVTNLTPRLTLVSPAPAGDYQAGTNLIVRALIDDPGNQVSNVVFYLDGKPRYTGTARLPEFTLGDIAAGTHTLEANTVLIDGTFIQATPLRIHVSSPRGFEVLVPNGSEWRYLDGGRDPGPGWQSRSYDHSSWAAGLAELGYGDAEFDRRPEATVISFGSNAANKAITTYFRREFTVADPFRYTNLVVRLMRDDGAVVYLNGVEVMRSNLPPGPIGPGQLADLATDDGTLFYDRSVSPDALLPGRNVVAVELHQSSPESSDVSFDLMLLARSAGPEFFIQPLSLVSPYCVDVTLHAEATGNPQYQWFSNNVVVPGAVGPFLTLSQVDRYAAGLYYALAILPGGIATSAVAEVQICLTKQGTVTPGVIATTNLAALFALQNSLPGGGGGGIQPSAAAPPQVQLSHGVPLYFTTQNGGASAQVPFICGVPSTHTKWVGYVSRIAQRLRISTEGSDFDTVLGVYTNSGGLTPTLVEVVCNRGTAAQPAGVVEFNAERKFYYIAVDGENGQTGTARLKIGLGVLQSPYYDPQTDTFHFEVTVRSNILSVVRSLSNPVLPGLTNFGAWTAFGNYVTNRDWVFTPSVPNASTTGRRHFGGREQ